MDLQVCIDPQGRLTVLVVITIFAHVRLWSLFENEQKKSNFHCRSDSGLAKWIIDVLTHQAPTDRWSLVYKWCPYVRPDKNPITLNKTHDNETWGLVGH